MNTLDEIAIKHGTDKGSKHPVINGHNYAVHYDRLFTPLREEPIKLLEIGVGGGESIKTWLEYFPNGRIFGVDLIANSNDFNTRGIEQPRYTFEQGDQNDGAFWDRFIAKHSGSFDIIIDDGSHYAGHIIQSWASLFGHVRPEGFYAIEDLAVAYGGPPFTGNGWQNHMDFIKDRLDDINRHNAIRNLTFSKELAVFQKA